jgi:diguanylate cyclase (GGDEF)-like protein
MRILVVDDDTVTRVALDTLLTQRGCEVVTAPDAEAADEILQREDSPRLAIIDWGLPGMSGLELCRKLRDADTARRTHVIMLTVKTGTEDVVTGLNAGADDYVRKPFDIDELYARIRAAERLIGVEDELRIQANVDELTGLLSRSAILDVLRRALARGARDKTPLSILLADIDRFKHVNDTYGHAIGDAALRGIAELLNPGLRPYDEIGRYGGEEFLIVLPGCGAGEAHDVAERIRTYTEGHAIDTSAGSLELTVSIGAATAVGDGDVSIDDLIVTADRALYEAKDAGRNRVVGSTDFSRAAAAIRPCA